VRTAFLASFLGDVRKVRDGKVRGQIARAIEHVERADSPNELPQFKWLHGHSRFARIRIGAGDWEL
jgi:hypothetical protein